MSWLGHDVHHPVVWLLPPPAGPAGPRGHRLRRGRHRAGPERREIVMAANNGNQTVPTLVYADGSAQTNPSLAQVKEKLAAMAVLTEGLASAGADAGSRSIRRGASSPERADSGKPPRRNGFSTRRHETSATTTVAAIATRPEPSDAPRHADEDPDHRQVPQIQRIGTTSDVAQPPGLEQPTGRRARHPDQDSGRGGDHGRHQDIADPPRARQAPAGHRQHADRR